MKINIDIPESLLEQVLQLARRQGLTVDLLVLRGLRRMLADEERDAAFVFRPVTCGGDGLQQDGEETGWERMRDIIYKGRGT